MTKNSPQFPDRAFHRAQNLDILFSDLSDRNVVDVDFISSDQIEQQIKRTFKSG